MGLERLRKVVARLPRFSGRVITIGGTNGKGSTTAFLESIYLAGGYRVGAYFSPHLERFNERIRLVGQEVDDAALCAAFAAVEEARVLVSLTYFEFATLAAFVLFSQANLDVALLEVGLGGRLDAVNVWDCDVAVIVSVGTDHKDWLGPDRETIGREKAGIMRSGRPVILGLDPPASVLAEALRIGARAQVAGRDFSYERTGSQWRYRGVKGVRDLPYPALRGTYQLHNAACALAAVDALLALPVSAGAIREGLVDVRLRGRFQTLPGQPTVVLDVAHNTEAAQVLAQTLRDQPVAGRTLAVVGMFQDKPLEATLAVFKGLVDNWYLATLADKRGASATRLAAALADSGQVAQSLCENVESAYQLALQAARPIDRVVVFGSFKTVGAIMSLVFPGERGHDG